jgi:cytochrome c-type biogenesis protein
VASRLGGGLLFLVGAYLAYYGWYEIRVLRGTTVTDPVIDTAGAVQGRLAETLDTIGVPAIATALDLLVLAAVVLRRRGARVND